MNKACMFFKVSDLVMHIPRNYQRYRDIKKVRGIPYDERYGNYTAADVFYKEGQDKYPVLINVHGGGFVKGDKRHRKSVCCYFARKGWFVYNINYRLAPPYHMPAGTQDVVRALQFLPFLAEKYKLDLDRVVITGDSAGGYYACSAILTNLNEEYRKAMSVPTYDVKIRGFLSFCSPFDVTKILNMKTPLNVSVDVASCLTGFKVKKNLSNLGDFPLIDKLNLLQYVGEDFPKSYLIISTHDSFCGGQGELMEEKLKEKGVEYTPYYATDEKDFHCFHLLPYHKDTAKCMAAAAAWLEEFKK